MSDSVADIQDTRAFRLSCQYHLIRDLITSIHTCTAKRSIGRLSSYDLFFHVVQLSEFLIPKFFWGKSKIKNHRKITSVLCLWAALCETIWGKHANNQWWAWLEWISKANKPKGKKKCDSSPVNPPQLNHHRWKKHTMYPNYIPDNVKQSTIAE